MPSAADTTRVPALPVALNWTVWWPPTSSTSSGRSARSIPAGSPPSDWPWAGPPEAAASAAHAASATTSRTGRRPGPRGAGRLALPNSRPRGIFPMINRNALVVAGGGCRAGAAPGPEAGVQMNQPAGARQVYHRPCRLRWHAPAGRSRIRRPPPCRNRPCPGLSRRVSWDQLPPASTRAGRSAEAGPVVRTRNPCWRVGHDPSARSARRNQACYRSAPGRPRPESASPKDHLIKHIVWDSYP